MKSPAAVASDPDAAPLDLDWSKAVLVIPPNKKAISIRVDQDVLDYFKKEGPGLPAAHQCGSALFCGPEAEPPKTHLAAAVQVDAASFLAANLYDSRNGEINAPFDNRVD